MSDADRPNRAHLKLVPFCVAGAALGLALGVWNLVSFWLNPLDDSLTGMLVIYVPMFICWGLAGFIATRRTGRLTDAVKAGAACAFSTFVVFWMANIIRVNLFLDVLYQWPGWATVVSRYRDSGFQSFRWFTNVDYLKDAPLKLATPTALGAILAVIGWVSAKLGLHGRLPTD